MSVFSVIVPYLINIQYFATAQRVLISSEENLNYEFDSNLNLNKCEKISIPLCQELRLYNQTIFPNFFNHLRQDEGSVSYFLSG